MNRAEQARLLRSAASALEHGRRKTASKKIEQALGGPLVIFVEGGIVQDVGRVSPSGFLEVPYDLVDYDTFETSEDHEVFLHWSSLSPAVQDYIRTKLPDEYEKFQERIRNIEASPEEAAMLERNKTY
jgi:hypothetical protein